MLVPVGDVARVERQFETVRTTREVSQNALAHCRASSFISRVGYNTKNAYMGKLVKSPRIDPRYACFTLVIKPSAIHRFGVYAGQRIPANRKAIEYTGERISNREANRRDWGKYTYLFGLDRYWTLDGSIGGSGAEII